ncbi:MAG: hypothetical protein ABI759_15855 [Candidatus Solibacter sp.]
MIRRILIGLVLLTACPAFSNTIIVAGLDPTLGLQQSVYFDEDGISSQAYWVGGITITVDGYSRAAFCVDLFTNISFDTYNTIMDYANTPNLARVSWLLQHQAPITQLGGAAFQLAVWDIIHDNGDGFDSGRVAKSSDPAHLTDPALLALAAQYEAVSVGQGSLYAIVYHSTTLSGGVQVQTLMSRPAADGGPSAAPESSSIFMIAGGLAMVGLGRLRRRPAAR